jgi:hypothetical protein
MAWPSAADVVVVVLALGGGVGEDVVEVVQPAARTAASITTANAPAKYDFFIVNPRKLFVTVLAVYSWDLKILGC